jgi:predicted dienelactone hydrolase
VDPDDAAGDFAFYTLQGPLGFDSTLAFADVPVSSAGPRPLIVFSHGFGGISIQSVRLMEHLASHGFVVVSPEHTGNTQTDMSSPDPEADRYPDVAFIIDEMGARNAVPGDSFEGRVDAQNVGVAGHSFGGMTAQFMAAGHPPFGPDLRVKAIMPVAASSNQLTDEELAGITVPTLLMVGTLDPLQTATIRSFDLIASAFLYRVDVVGANHTHFANVCDIGNTLIDLGVTIDQWPSIGAGALVPIYADTCVPPAFPIEEATRLQNLYAVAHFRRHLLGEGYYDRFLTGAYAAAREPDTVFFGGGTPVLDHFMFYSARTT